MDDVTLQELHRHRDFHAAQLNAVNYTGSIGAVGITVTIFLGAPAPPGSTWMAWTVVILLGLASVMLAIAISMHWRWHSGQIRKIDGLIDQCLKDEPSFSLAALPDRALSGLAPEWSRAYLLAGVGVIMLSASGIAYLIDRIL